MRLLPFFAIAALAGVLGCSHRVPLATVEVIDMSLSITPRAEQVTLDAVHAQIGRMERGDILILVPITGDEANDAGGRVLHLEAPRTRESYDADMTRFRSTADSQFAAWSAALGNVRNRSDILGSMDLARQEMDSLPSRSQRRLIVLSDFLEDDGQFRFASDAALGNPGEAQVLADRIRAQHEFGIVPVRLCLGRLESTDFPSLPPQRKAAIEAFWAAYFSSMMRRGPVIQIDPAGILAGADSDCFFAQS